MANNKYKKTMCIFIIYMLIYIHLDTKSIKIGQCNEMLDELLFKPSVAAILKMAAILSSIMNIKRKFRSNGFLNADIDTKNLKISQRSEVLDSKL